jgi:hypothetical protein
VGVGASRVGFSMIFPSYLCFFLQVNSGVERQDFFALVIGHFGYALAFYFFSLISCIGLLHFSWGIQIVVFCLVSIVGVGAACLHLLYLLFLYYQ